MKKQNFYKWSAVFSLALICLNCAGSQDVFEAVPEEEIDETTEQAVDVDVAVPACTSVAYYEDVDNDGYGNPETLSESCTQPEGYITDGTDCDDASPFVNPGMDGLDDNSGYLIDVYAAYLFEEIDNDCDGEIDEDTLTISGQTFDLSIPYLPHDADP